MDRESWTLSHIDLNRGPTYLYLAVWLPPAKFKYLWSAGAAVLHRETKVNVAFAFDDGAEPSNIRQHPWWIGARPYQREDEDYGATGVKIYFGEAPE